MRYINLDLNPPLKENLSYWADDGFKLANCLGDSEVFGKTRAKRFMRAMGKTLDARVYWKNVEIFLSKEGKRYV